MRWSPAASLRALAMAGMSLTLPATTAMAGAHPLANNKAVGGVICPLGCQKLVRNRILQHKLDRPQSNIEYAHKV